MQVELAETYDIKAWMDLAQEVAPLFGPMDGFETVLRRKIWQRQAYCVRSPDQRLMGAMLFGGVGKEFWIRWLAVSLDARRQGVGRSLVNTAILITPLDSTLSVDTFAEGEPGAMEAGGLYRSCGFEPTERWQENQIVRDRYKWASVSSDQDQ
ncbi:GNAT family N-acetyltransferase [Aliirhizobium terrae]|uniref:GNAT family N-acetyltransferase n=1 Tax=Terrirhizobium terrae TaxID=2926709 RepID=UPI002578158E|nr:GNAT family N-acetyltransferase [Rhizobium sp. CC-CFT758]WJH39399.1 GNAT family N-acetyltransferase [Rhizobium sp. CC-CFT758]